MSIRINSYANYFIFINNVYVLKNHTYMTSTIITFNKNLKMNFKSYIGICVNVIKNLDIYLT